MKGIRRERTPSECEDEVSERPTWSEAKGAESLHRHQELEYERDSKRDYLYISLKRGGSRMSKTFIIFFALVLLFVFSLAAIGQEQGKELSLKKKDYKMEKKDYQVQIFTVIILISLAFILG